ncbi:hypothetical protein GCM10009000_093050 [Halobacterium noricense]
MVVQLYFQKQRTTSRHVLTDLIWRGTAAREDCDCYTPKRETWSWPTSFRTVTTGSIYGRHAKDSHMNDPGSAMGDSPPGSLQPSDDDSTGSSWWGVVWILLPFLLFVILLAATIFLAS